MCFGIRFVLDLSAQARMFERFFHRMFGDFERKHAMAKILVAGFIMKALNLFLEAFEFLHERLELSFMSYFSLSHPGSSCQL
jgi:hypothetical protein